MPSEILRAWQDMRWAYNAIEEIPNLVKMYIPACASDNKQFARAGLYHYCLGYLINYVYVMVLFALVIGVVNAINKKRV